MLLTPPPSPCRLSEGGVACPEVVLLKKHVLVMSFIGHDQIPAPTLKEAPLSRDQLTSAYQQCIQVHTLATLYF